MKIEININKAYIALFLVLILSMVVSFVFGQTTEFGHTYTELDLVNSISSTDIQDSSITTSDIQDNTITANDIAKSGGHVALNVIRAKNSGAASCNFLITQCGSTSTGQACGDIPGYYQVPGGFSFIGVGWDEKAYTASSPCASGGRVVLCCQQFS